MIEQKPFGWLPDGRVVTLFTINNSSGEYIELLDFGAAVHSIYVYDMHGKLGDVVLGVGSTAGLCGFSFEGSTIGRCANRIAYAKYEIGGRVTQLEKNLGDHFLHGASGNYAYKMFRAEIDNENNTVCFYLRDKGEGGFECEADVRVSYTFDDDHRLEIRYDIKPEGDTVINPTNHAYFNLSDMGDARDHQLRILAEEIAPNGDIGMPVGEIRKVKGTPVDFTELRTLREAMESDSIGYFDNRQLQYDDFFILSKEGFGLAAEVKSRESGRIMKVYTDMPALVLFTPHFPMPGIGKNGKIYDGYSSLCLETQFVPNAVNCPQYTSPICRKGEKFISRTVYEFLICK